MSFSFYSPLTVTSSSTLLPSTQANFPILVSYTDTRLKTASNGGHVQNSSGFDIRPYSDSALTSAMTYELEFYDGINGILVMWVLKSSLALSDVFYLAYGNSALSTDGSSASTWDSNFKGIYHLKDGTTLNVNSATGANNGTNNGCTAGTGQIDGCAVLASSGPQYVSIADDSSLNFGTGVMTASAWFKTSTTGASQGIASKDDASDTNGWSISVNFSNKIEAFFTGGGADDLVSPSTYADGNWHHVVFLRNGTNSLLYADGSQVQSKADGLRNISNTQIMAIGLTRSGDPTSGGFNGSLDEVRVSNIARSADWITAEYNSQHDPTTFLALGSEISNAPAPKRTNFMYFMPPTTK